MRKIKEVLHLKWELGLAARQVAHSFSISHSTVLGMLRRAEEAGFSWPVPDLDDAALEAKLYPLGPELPKNRPEPDLASCSYDGSRNRQVTLLLLLTRRAIPSRFPTTFARLREK